MGRIDRFQRHHRTAGFPLAVIYKFFDDQGTYLAALLTYYGFLSLFPLLLLLASLVGFVLQGNPEWQQRIFDSAASQFPLIGQELGGPRGLRGNTLAVAVGAAVALYGALGVTQAFQNAMNVLWSVPRHRRPNPLRARLRSLILIALIGMAVMATTVLSALGRIAAAYGTSLGAPLTVMALLAALMLSTVLFAVSFRISTAVALRMRDVLPGAVVAAICWQVLQVFGAAYAAHVFDAASATYGVFAFVLGLFAWIYLVAISVVISVEINVVRARRLYPRALLTPFTDRVELTDADRKVYTDAAVAQRMKGFESAVVGFDPAAAAEPGDAPVPPG